jgi:hypothetical protein
MPNRWIRRPGYLIGGPVTVVAALVVAIYGVTGARTGKTFHVAAASVPVAHDFHAAHASLSERAGEAARQSLV